MIDLAPQTNCRLPLLMGPAMETNMRECTGFALGECSLLVLFRPCRPSHSSSSKSNLSNKLLILTSILTSMPTTARSGMSTMRSGMSGASGDFPLDTERMNDLKKVKQELEEALRQVKNEMRHGGATKSEIGGSTARTQIKTARTNVSGSTATSSVMGTNWEVWGRGLPKPSK